MYPKCWTVKKIFAPPPFAIIFAKTRCVFFFTVEGMQQRHIADFVKPYRDPGH